MNDKSVWDLITEASIIVQSVMGLLLLASVISWLIILHRAKLLASANKAIKKFEKRFWSGIDLAHLYQQVNRHPDESSGMENVFRAGFKEFSRLRQQNNIDPDAIMEGSHRAMRVALAREEEQLAHHVPILATIGSTSPYVGLFGTVWGIMNTFIGIQGDAVRLSAIAPGIAEALIATAMGLVAAIPAVIAYNRFTTKINALMNSYDTFADEFSSILHRTVHSDSPVEEAA